MKILIAISILCLSTLLFAVVSDIYDINVNTHVSMSDLPEDGNSEKETYEESEEDSEKDSFSPLETADSSSQKIDNKRYTYLSKVLHYLETPNPPP